MCKTEPGVENPAGVKLVDSHSLDYVEFASDRLVMSISVMQWRKERKTTRTRVTRKCVFGPSDTREHYCL